MASDEPTREELFELVWSKPCTAVAAELGVSDVALGKLCKRLQVPKPPRGYWARVQAGRRVRKPPLPALREATGQEHSHPSKKPAGVHLSPRKKELFLRAVEAAIGAGANAGTYELRADRLVSIDPDLASAVIVTAGNEYANLRQIGESSAAHTAAEKTARELIDQLLPLSADKVVVFRRERQGKFSTDEAILVRFTDALVREVAGLRNLVVEHELAFVGRSLDRAQYHRQIRYAYAAEDPIAASTELCVSRDSLWVRAHERWDGQLFETERVPLAKLAPLDAITPSIPRLLPTLPTAFYDAYLPGVQRLLEAEQACDLAEEVADDLGMPEMQHALNRALRLWWAPERLETIRMLEGGLREARTELEKWRQEIDVEKDLLCEEVLGLRVGDHVIGERHGKQMQL